MIVDVFFEPKGLTHAEKEKYPCDSLCLIN